MKKRVRIYAVVEVDEESTEIASAIADVFDGIIGDPLFVATGDGYTNEFAALGADPTTWKEPDEYEGIFVHGKNAQGEPQTICAACLSKHPEIDIGDVNVDVWEIGSDGWTAAPICSTCKKEIDVIVGTETVPS